MSNKLNNFKQINGKLEDLRTPNEWSKFFQIKILSFNDAFTVESFNDKSIDKITFLNLAATCTIEKPPNSSRFDIQKMKRNLIKKVDNN